MAQGVNAHDLYFKNSLSEPGVAADFVAHYLPGEVAAALDLDTLALSDGSFVDERLRDQHSDLLFSAGLREGGGEALVYLLFEHKSRVQRAASMQLLRYCLAVWERDLRAEPKLPLRTIIPVLVYHGRARWTAPTEIGELFGGPQALRRYRPQFGFALLDLGSLAEADVAGGALLRVALLMLRAIFRPDLGTLLPRIAAILRPVADRALARRWLMGLLSYSAAVGDRLTTAQLTQAAQAAEPVRGANVMPTLAEQWLAQGRVEGRRAGLGEGRSAGYSEGVAQARAALLEAIEAVLDLRFGAASQSLLAEIRGLEDVAELQRLLRLGRRAQSLDELRADWVGSSPG